MALEGTNKCIVFLTNHSIGTSISSTFYILCDEFGGIDWNAAGSREVQKNRLLSRKSADLSSERNQGAGLSVWIESDYDLVWNSCDKLL